MPIPTLNSASVERALLELLPELEQLKAGPHDSTKYDLLWKGKRFPPKVVVSRAAKIQCGSDLPESEFSGGDGVGQANKVLRDLGFEIVAKASSTGQLSLEPFHRYGRKEAFAAVGISYDQQQRHLNVGLPPRCDDGGYFIFITLNKEGFDPTHDYEDLLFFDQFIWVTRRGVTEDHDDYLKLRLPDTRVSLFVRNRSNEDFVYAGELEYQEHNSFEDPSSHRPQMRFVWALKTPLPEELYKELTLGPPQPSRSNVRNGAKRDGHSRAPSTFDELRKAYSYVLGAAERTVVPEHQNYQVRLAQFFKDRRVIAKMEKNFVDVSFTLDQASYIGEIKVTRNLTIAQAFRAALGQLLEYGHLLFPEPPKMVMFLDQEPDSRRLELATKLSIAVVSGKDERFVLLNPDCCSVPSENSLSERHG